MLSVDTMRSFMMMTDQMNERGDSYAVEVCFDNPSGLLGPVVVGKLREVGSDHLMVESMAGFIRKDGSQFEKRVVHVFSASKIERLAVVPTDVLPISMLEEASTEAQSDSTHVHTPQGAEPN